LKIRRHNAVSDSINKITEWFDHNRGFALAMVFVLSLTLWLTACKSTTVGFFGQEKVDRAALEAQILTLAAKFDARQATLNSEKEAAAAAADIKIADLDHQDAVKASIVEIGAGLVTSAVGGTFNPTQLMTTLVGVGGILGAGGLFFDNRRKDRRINVLKNGGEPTTDTT
jgi:hypothetical protein